MNFKGFHKLSLIDYPHKLCAVLFIGGCNFRCYFCHNPELVIGYSNLTDIPDNKVLPFLYKRRGFLDAVCITGGEPTLFSSKDHQGDEFFEFISQVKKLQFLVKLDTNGTNPDFIAKLIEAKFLDYVAMDIKTTPPKYPEVVEMPANMNKINDSIKLLMSSGIDYEFRTTVFPNFFSKSDAKEIADWLKGAKAYVLQKPTTIKMLSKGKIPNLILYTDDELVELSKLLPNCTIR